MLICHSRPQSITWSLDSTSSGETWISDDLGDDLTNNRPGLGSVVQWCTGAQTTSSHVDIMASWSSPTAIGIAALLGVSLPDGTLVRIRGRPAGSGSYSLSMGHGLVYTRSRGDKVLVVDTTETTDLLDGIMFRLVNDVAGSATIPADFQFSIGEAMFGPVENVCMQIGWGAEYSDTTITQFSTTGQSWESVGVQYWTISTAFGLRRRSTMFDGSADPSIFLNLIRKLDRSQPIIIVPRDNTGHSIEESSIYGVVTEITGYRHIAKNYYDPGSIKVREIPVPV